MNNTLVKLMLVAVFGLISSLKAAQVDIGITLGSVIGASGVISNARVELGTFTSYSDVTGLGYFSGKDYNTLRSSFTLLNNLDNSTNTDSLGNYYGAYDTASTASGTRLFAWIFSSASASSNANWAIISGGGTGANASTYNPVWLAVAPAAVDVNVIEAATVYTQIYAATSGASLVANTTIDPEGVNISLVPEPSTGALMMIGAVGLVALRRLRKV